MFYEEYKKILKSIFPNSIISFEENVDDINSGFEIITDKKEIIELRFNFNNPVIMVIYYSVVTGYRDIKEVKNYRIFGGTIPVNKRTQKPDFSFVKKVIQNIKSFK